MKLRILHTKASCQLAGSVGKMGCGLCPIVDECFKAFPDDNMALWSCEDGEKFKELFRLLGEAE